MTGLYSYDEFVLNEGLVDNVKNKAKKVKFKAELAVLKEKLKKVDNFGYGISGMPSLSCEGPKYIKKFIDESQYDSYLKLEAKINDIESKIAEIDGDNEKIDKCKQKQEDIELAAKAYKHILNYDDSLFQQDAETDEVDDKDVAKMWVEFYQGIVSMYPEAKDSLQKSIDKWKEKAGMNKEENNN